MGIPLANRFASIINYSAGVNLANGLAVALCNPSAATCSDDITIQANNSTTHVVADVQGYYQRVGTGGVGAAPLADAAVTAPKIGSGVVVRSLNGLTDAVTLAAGTNVSITLAGSTLTISASGTSGPYCRLDGRYAPLRGWVKPPRATPWRCLPPGIP